MTEKLDWGGNGARWDASRSSWRGAHSDPSPAGLFEIIVAEARALGSGSYALTRLEPTGTWRRVGIVALPRCLGPTR